MRDLLAHLIPQGLTVPVSPGTSFVTIGGMLASDVHGKNHHADGSFGSHVNWVELVDGEAQLRRLSPPSPEFWATVGGMGLTGVMTRLSFTPLHIPGPFMSVTTEPFEDIHRLMEAMVDRDASSRYSVAWVDTTGGAGRAGRGILTTGTHASVEGSYRPPSPQPIIRAPRWLPGGLLNRRTVAAFNAAWFVREGRPRTDHLQPLGQFFHPLDGVGNWNRVYGERGFLQFQFTVADESSSVIPRVITECAARRAPSFLTVLKRFGAANPGHLSFPTPGWTLAMDLSTRTPDLQATIAYLDHMVLDAGGRFYLAKDAHASAQTFATGYPRLAEWKSVRSAMDPHGVFVSDLARRLDLT